MQNIISENLLTQSKVQIELSDFLNKLSPQVVEKFDAILGKPKKPLVYTSFDGDNMHYLDWMCYVAHKLGCVPVNPEAALGYYLSTTSHNGKKIEVMRDCVALELACTELWIFDSSLSIQNSSLSEGVIAEFVLWHQIRPHLPVRFFPYLQESMLMKHKNSLEEKSSEQILFQSKLPLDYQKELVTKMEHLAIREIEEKLLLSIKENHVRPLAYISQDFFDLKHVDWARAIAYQLGYVPFSPETLVRHFVTNMAYGESLPEEYLIDRISLLSAAQELWIFSKTPVSLFSKNPLQEHTKLDIYYWLTHKPTAPIRVFSWRDASVPKFMPNNFWALTTREHLENTEHDREK